MSYFRFFLALLIFALSFPSPALCFSGQAEEYKQASRLFSLYLQSVALEEEDFRRRAFRLAGRQMPFGTNFKLMLEDDRGKLWMFKEKGRSRIAAYRLFSLFGTDTPRTHSFNLVLNGKPLKGTLQEFLQAENSGEFQCPESASLERNSAYLLRCMVLDWLTGNYDLHCGNFLSLDKGERLVHIDFDTTFTVKGVPRKEFMFYVSNDASRINSYDTNIYHKLFRKLEEGEVSLDLGYLCSFAGLVQSFPEEYIKLVLLARKVDNPEAMKADKLEELERECEDHILPVLARKRGLYPDFLGFCRSIVPEAKQEQAYGREFYRKSVKRFKEKIRGLKSNAGPRHKGDPETLEVSGPFSPGGLEAMKRAHKAVLASKGQEPGKACEKEKQELERLRADSGNYWEAAVLDRYLEEIARWESGEKPACQTVSDINRLTGDILEKFLEERRNFPEP